MVDDIMISMPILRRILKCMELYSNKNESDPLKVALFLTDQLEGYGRLHVHKLHHLSSIQALYVVTKSTTARRL